jgi:hypothetical protein
VAKAPEHLDVKPLATRICGELQCGATQ